MSMLPPAEYWIHHTIFYSLLLGIHYANGRWVIRRGIRVNYTRKINHFAVFFLPPLLRVFVPYDYNPQAFLVDIGLTFFFLTMFTRPFRSRSSVLLTMFRSFDRPEDRPFTLLWLSTQFLVSYLVLIPLLMYFSEQQILPLIFIVILTAGIGDGLAEPVGVRFGKHKYTTYALFTKRRYTRSIEGSACVFFTCMLCTLGFSSYFTDTQFIMAITFLPILLTLAEAWSPHTWDSPFIYLVGGVTLIAIISI